MQEDTHVFKGMQRDIHPIKQNKDFLWEAHNIRLTTRDGDNLLSITNEKSTDLLYQFNGADESYIGHTVVGNYLVLFTKTADKDIIYRIDLNRIKEEKQSYNPIILYKEDLGLEHDCPIQAIGDYEAELVQKVYWVDGKNNPRVINIAKPELLEAEDALDYTKLYKDAPFGFVQELDLLEEVDIERMPNGSGIFHSGTIQYAFTYYHKYGQESNIFHTSEVLYIAHNDRGGSPEDDSISTSFKINVKNIQKSFSYLRIYSIIRTSINSVPTVKRVEDIELSEVLGNEITYIDNGTTGDVVDPAVLLYLGGKDIVAGCICAKDNTLFLGDITYKRKEASAIEGLSDSVKGINIECKVRTETFGEDKNPGNQYKYFNQLLKNTSTYKVGEWYRLGVQFQYKNGEWSEPIWITDKAMTGVFPDSNDTALSLPIFEASIPDKIKELMLGEDYLKVRPIVVLPSIKDRSILAQGLLCPTVFNAGDRKANRPFSQASWFLRPFTKDIPGSDSDDINAEEGAIVEFAHLRPLLTGLKRGSEIQNMYLEEDNLDTSLYNTKNKINKKDSSYKSLYYVDQSIITLHSPDILFDEALINALSDNTELSIKLVGIVPFNFSYGDLDIQMSTVVADPKASGFIHQAVINNTDGGRGLVSGLFYEDSAIDEWENAEEFKKEDPIRAWMVYLWHRSGSLNNDCVRPDGKGNRTSVYKKKIISNIRFSNKTYWLNNNYPIDTSEIKVFNSNEVSMVKLKDSNNINGDLIYYGNIDSLNSSHSKYKIVTGDQGDYSLVNSTAILKELKIEAGGYEYSQPSLRMTVNYANESKGVLQGIIMDDNNIISWADNEEPVNTNLNGAKVIVYISKIIQLPEVPYNITEGKIISQDGYEFTIKGGKTTYSIEFQNDNTSLFFSSPLSTIDETQPHVGDYQEALKYPKDPVRIKYKSTPHAVFATKYKDGVRPPLPILSGTGINGTVNKESLYWLKDTSSDNFLDTIIYPNSFVGLDSTPNSYLWIAEIHQKVEKEKIFGGQTRDALMANQWIPAGPAVRLDSNESVQWRWGDTWYQRYDCMKTYPYTFEDENQLIEIGSFMCESRVNIDGRYDRNRGSVSNLNMSPINFNLLNSVYTNKNDFFNYRILDEDYYKVNSYPSQILWTMTKSPSGIQDDWTNLHMANNIDLDGVNGRVTSIQSYNETLLGFQETGINNILFNSRVQITPSDGVPIELANSSKVEGTRIISDTIGCQDKFSVVTTPSGIYFIDNNNNSIYNYNSSSSLPVNVSNNFGTLYWPRENHSDWTWRFKAPEKGFNGVRLYYDPKHQDIYFTPGSDFESIREALCFSEQLGHFTSLMSYGGAVMFSHKSKFYSIANDKNGKLSLWENFPEDSNSYNNIFNIRRPFSFSFISNDNSTLTKIFDTVEMRTDQYDNKVLLGDKYSTHVQEGQPFSYIRANNEYQDTGNIPFNRASLRKKFRVWRALIPRNKNTRERIRNPWTKITLGNDTPEDKLTILHDLTVKYTV